MNSTPQFAPEKGRAHWLLGVVVLSLILGAVWLAAYLTSYPQAALALAKKYGVFIWILLALAWSIQCLVRKKKRK